MAESKLLYYLISPTDYGGTGHFGFTYHSALKLAPGELVEIPLGRSFSLGVVIESTVKPEFVTKPIRSKLDLPPLPAHLLALANWLSDYYLANAKSVWQTILPSGLTKNRRSKKAAVAAQKSERKTEKVKLSTEQQSALETIVRGQLSTYLINGVTGSGKTQIYIELAKRALLAGRDVIVLVPEIALTPQLVSNFESAFGEVVIKTHSKLTEAERHHAWQNCLDSKTPRVAVGPRSALFLPLKNPGLIVIDESHETSYKQEQSPRYHSEIVAAKLARLTGAKLVLGSATPSLNELYWASVGRIGLVTLTKRFNQIPPVKPVVVDLRDKSLLKSSRFLSSLLIERIKTTLQAGRQSLLFINRRGSASSLICADCGWVAVCPPTAGGCGLPLTFHADRMQLICHICNFRQPPPAICPDCQGANLRYVGGGTKRIEAEVARLFPAARIARLDRDSATPRYLSQVYESLKQGEVDILIGTQMIAKGLDLPAVDLVGIVSADTQLYIPDFTAAERTYQLIAQVSGRTGRGDRAGEVIIQSYTPDHPAIKAAASLDFERFSRSELTARQLLAYPPYVHLLKLTVASKSAQTAEQKATELGEALRTIEGLQLIGPAPAFRERSAGSFHWQLVARSKSRKTLVQAASQVPSGWTIDLDPINLL